MKNADRTLVDSLKRYGERNGVTVEFLSHDWIAVLARGSQRHLVFGYDLGLNGATAAKIANDKGATYSVLAAGGLPAVEHRVFLHPRFLDFLPVDGNWREMNAAFEAFGRDAVIKDNEGTGGLDVHRVRSHTELEQRAHQLFQIARSVTLAPFLPIEDEVRFVMLGDECLLAYRKERQAVVGDGVQTVGELIAAGRKAGQLASAPSSTDVALSTVPAASQYVPLQWRHNLGLGARAIPLEASDPSLKTALALATTAMRTLTLRFASIDVVTIGGAAMVLEANAGVMLEVASRPEFGGPALADRIYHRALDCIFQRPG